MSEIDELVKIQNNVSVNIGNVDVQFLTDRNGDAWLTKDSIVKILCRDGDYSFRSSFPAIFESKVVLGFNKERIKAALIGGQETPIFHESVLYGGMFEANTIAGFNNDGVKKMLDDIFMEVLPCLRKYGQYPAPNQSKDVVPSKWGAIREMAAQMQDIAKLGEEHDQRITELEWKTSVIDEEKVQDQKEIEYLKFGQKELQNQLDEFLGTPDHRTVRLRMMELGIKRTIIENSKMKVGMECKKYCQTKNISLPEKVVEGRFMVNQYPNEVIDSVMTQLKLIHR